MRESDYDYFFESCSARFELVWKHYGKIFWELFMFLKTSPSKRLFNCLSWFARLDKFLEVSDFYDDCAFRTEISDGLIICFRRYLAFIWMSLFEQPDYLAYFRISLAYLTFSSSSSSYLHFSWRAFSDSFEVWIFSMGCPSMSFRTSESRSLPS